MIGPALHMLVCMPPHCRRVVRRLLYIDSKSLLHNANAVRFGWSKEALSALIPMTSTLISSRGRSYENIGVGYCLQEPLVITKEHPVGVLRVDDSWLEMVLPFTDHSSMRESMMRDDGKTLRYGRLFELLDSLAGDIAYRHCGGRKGPLTIVTASVDSMKNFANLSIHNDIKMQGYLTYVGSSSMEVAIDVLSVDVHSGEAHKKAEVKFIMVARHGDRAMRIPGLILANDEARRLFEVGSQRARARRSKAQHSLSVSPPRPEEVHMIHNLYLTSIAQRKRIDPCCDSGRTALEVALGEQSKHSLVDNGRTASSSSLVGDDQSSLVYSSASTDFRWMSHTIFKSCQLMHVQNRNVHGKIFGGYIMKKAFEIAYVSAISFFRESYPRFLLVDEVQFVKPMNVGSIVQFISTVVYSSQDHIVVQVVVVATNPSTGCETTTNIFSYVFRASEENQLAVPLVMPRDYEEIVLYLGGKRTLDHFLDSDKEQAYD